MASEKPESVGKGHDEVSVGDVGNLRPRVAVGMGGGNRVKGGWGRSWSEPSSAREADPPGRYSAPTAGGEVPRTTSGEVISCDPHTLGACSLETFLLSSRAVEERIYLKFIMRVA